MCLLAKFGDYRSSRTGDTNSYINSYMNTLQKVTLTASIRYIAQCLKSGITNLQFTSPRYGWQKNETKKKNTDNYEAFCVNKGYQQIKQNKKTNHKKTRRKTESKTKNKKQKYKVKNKQKTKILPLTLNYSSCI